MNYYGIRIRGNYLTISNTMLQYFDYYNCPYLFHISNTLCRDECNKKNKKKVWFFMVWLIFQILSLMFIYLVTCYKQMIGHPSSFRDTHSYKILFLVKVNSHQQQPIPLFLSPQNYQQQFSQFVLYFRLSKDQAMDLKIQIEKALQQKVLQALMLINKEQMRQKQLKKANVDKSPKMGSIQRNEDHIFKNSIEKKQFEVQTEILGEMLDKIKIQTKQSGFPNQINRLKAPNSASKKQPTKIATEVSHFNDVDVNYSRKNGDQFSLHYSYDEIPHIQDNVHSPRFNQPQIDSLEGQQIARQLFNREDDQQPRQSPNMKVIINQETQANSPQVSSKQVVSSRKKLPMIDKLQISKESKEGNKKLFFLQNYQNQKGKHHSKSTEKKQSVSPKVEKQKPNPQIYKKLYETQTASFKSKKMQQINMHDQMLYQQFLDMQVEKKPVKIQGFQNMSLKTTQSFRAKLLNEEHLREAEQIRASQISFQQHLKRKQEERKLRQRLNKSTEKKDVKFQLKGPHCEYKLKLQQKQKMKKKQAQQEQRIKDRIKQEKRTNKHRDLSKHSCSPASKSISRVCPSCTPRKQKSSHEKQHVISSVKNGELKKSPHKKYSSKALQQPYQEFKKQIGKLN